MSRPVGPETGWDELPIASIELDARSRDDIPKTLRSLQDLHADRQALAAVFAILDGLSTAPGPGEGKTTAGSGTDAPRMTPWRILVLGVLRVMLDADEHRIADLANQHRTIRRFLGHESPEDGSTYAAETLRECLQPITPEVVKRIEQVMVEAGHPRFKRKKARSVSAETVDALSKRIATLRRR